MFNPYEQYKKTSINTMTKGELLLLLFDELIKRLNYSIVLIENKDFTQSKEYLEKCRKIINHLMISLDESFNISNELNEIYLFLSKEIIKASCFNDAKYITEIMPIVKDLRETWAEADKIAKASKI